MAANQTQAGLHEQKGDAVIDVRDPENPEEVLEVVCTVVGAETPL